MKLLSVHVARALWFCPFQDLNPRGLSLYPLVPVILGLYKFKKFPIEEKDFELSQEIKFENGEFTNKDGHVILVNFTIFPDGLLAETRSSTKDSDAFLADLLSQLSNNYDLPPYEGIIRNRNYLSQLFVSMDKLLNFFNPKLQEISNYLTSNVEGHNNVPFEIGSIAFWPDQIRTLNPSPFTLERVFNVPFSEKRYFSSSALHTDEHLDLLNKLESLL